MFNDFLNIRYANSILFAYSWPHLSRLYISLQVVAIIPKPDQFAEENNERKRRVARTASQSRKYLGPVRYPVTPIKTILSPIRHQLSLLADSDDEQVFIWISNY